MATWTLGVTFSFIIGVLIRVVLLGTSLPRWLKTRNEILTPLTSWERVEEGIALRRSFVSPYSGDVFHETPLLIRLLTVFASSATRTNILFLVVDVIIGIILVQIGDHFGRYMLKKQKDEQKSYSVNAAKLLLKVDNLRSVRFLPVLVHFLSPYSIATCIAHSTGVFCNLAVLLVLLYTLKGNYFMSLLCVAVASYLSLYPVSLVVPVAAYFYKERERQLGRDGSGGLVASCLQSVLVVTVLLAALLLLSYSLEGSWEFLRATYGFILTVPDLVPNIGVFWYFFTEMFEHFNTFFLAVFQINAFIYTLPLAIKLRNSPVFFMHMVICLMGIFKSYPSYADAALSLCLLPLWKHTFPYMRNKLVSGSMFVVATMFAPILHHLWIYSGSANANFYFAITLCYSTAAIFLMQDSFFAFLRREWDLQHGCEHKLPDGQPAQVVLT